VSVGSEPYTPENVLDRLSRRATLEFQYAHMHDREELLIRRHLGIEHGEVLSIGAGWHPGRHMFPAPAFRITAVDADPAKVQGVIETGRADAASVGLAGALAFEPESFDAVLYRLVLHHIAYHGSLTPCFTEAVALLRPGGALVVIEPGLWHPVGFALAAANTTGLATRLHGTPDDIPLSPRELESHARTVGLRPEIHAVTYTWRRLPPTLQRALHPLDRLGSRPRLAPFGHTLMLIARRPVAGTA
jgi:SAM-dependent methyltransferase